MPSRGSSQVSKAASTRAGLAIQRISSARRGKIPANSAKMQPISASKCAGVG